MGEQEAGHTLYKIALLLEYEGTDYVGFQLQPRGRTVQGQMERAIEELTGTFSRVHGASRTDAGAHALGQLVTFQTRANLPLRAYVHGLNYRLPPDIRVQRAYAVPVTFNPRRDAYARVYQYRLLCRASPSALLRRQTYRVPVSLDLPLMRDAARYLAGVRDFAPFARHVDNGSTVRRLDRADVQQEGELVVIEIEGNAFLPQQVRRIAGALVRVGTGHLALKTFQEYADGGRRDVLVPTLPAAGLFLIRVRYHNFPPEEGQRMRGYEEDPENIQRQAWRSGEPVARH